MSTENARDTKQEPNSRSSNGVVSEIRYFNAVGRPPLTPHEISLFHEIIVARADEIVIKWIDYFVMHKPIKAGQITRRLK